MAKSTKEKQELKQLVEQAEQARAKISATSTKVSKKLNFVGQAKGSVKKDPMKWVGGSAALGLVASFLLRPKKKKVVVKASRLAAVPRSPGGFVWKLLVLIVKFVKPAAKIYATKLVKDYLQGQIQSGASARPRPARIAQSR
ncbi:MAG: hypothetical protein ACSHX7_06525 [Luteolibacter sp.]